VKGEAERNKSDLRPESYRRDTLKVKAKSGRPGWMNGAGYLQKQQISADPKELTNKAKADFTLLAVFKPQRSLILLLNLMTAAGTPRTSQAYRPSRNS
jgi:hypothetical protein